MVATTSMFSPSSLKVSSTLSSESTNNPLANDYMDHPITKQVGSWIWQFVLKEHSQQQQQQQDQETDDDSLEFKLSDWLKHHVTTTTSTTLSSCPFHDPLFLSQCVQLYHWMKSTIVILDEHSNPNTCSFCNDIPGMQCTAVPSQWMQVLKRHVPKEFPARVADFNFNLSFAMQDKGLLNLFHYHSSSMTSSNDDDDDDDHQDHHVETYPHINRNEEELENAQLQSFLSQLETKLQQMLHEEEKSNNKKESESIEFRGSFLRTEEETIPQPPHVDYPWTTLEEYCNTLYIAFCPLNKDGMFLQIWKTHDSQYNNPSVGTLVYIPQGAMVIVPSDTVHGGGFRYSSSSSSSLFQQEQNDHHHHHGNVRFHLYISSHGTSLPNHPQNQYTEKDNKAYELGERQYLPNPLLPVFQHVFFD